MGSSLGPHWRRPWSQKHRTCKHSYDAETHVPQSTRHSLGACSGGGQGQQRTGNGLWRRSSALLVAVLDGVRAGNAASAAAAHSCWLSYSSSSMCIGRGLCSSVLFQRLQEHKNKAFARVAKLAEAAIRGKHAPGQAPLPRCAPPTPGACGRGTRTAGDERRMNTGRQSVRDRSWTAAQQGSTGACMCDAAELAGPQGMHGRSAAQQGRKLLAGPQTLRWRAPAQLDREGQAPLLPELLPQHRPPGHPPAHLLLPAPVEARVFSAVLCPAIQQDGCASRNSRAQSKGL